MANFALCYAVENGNLKIFFDNEMTVGRGLQDGFYRRCYMNSIKVGKYHHDGLLYCLLRIKDTIGWEPFKKVMRKLIGTDNQKKSPTEALNIWMEMLIDESGINVKALFEEGEYKFIMSQEKL